jgi:hypothetical protein
MSLFLFLSCSWDLSVVHVASSSQPKGKRGNVGQDETIDILGRSVATISPRQTCLVPNRGGGQGSEAITREQSHWPRGFWRYQAEMMVSLPCLRSDQVNKSTTISSFSYNSL